MLLPDRSRLRSPGSTASVAQNCTALVASLVMGIVHMRRLLQRSGTVLREGWWMGSVARAADRLGPWARDTVGLRDATTLCRGFARLYCVGADRSPAHLSRATTWRPTGPTTHRSKPDPKVDRALSSQPARHCRTLSRSLSTRHQSTSGRYLTRSGLSWMDGEVSPPLLPGTAWPAHVVSDVRPFRLRRASEPG